MAIADLKDLYIDLLRDLHSADRQAQEVTRELVHRAHDERLGRALEDGIEGIGRGIEAVGRLVRQHGADPEGEPCRGMEGLVREAREHAIEPDFGTDEARDAMIASQYRRMVHYALAGYGSCATLARRLELAADARMLEDCLRQTRDGDERVSRIAEQAPEHGAA